MVVLKFGGTSLGSAEQIRKVVEIIKSNSQTSKQVVVVSAFGGVTDQLILAAQLAAEGDERYLTLKEQIEQRHLFTIKKLIASRNQSEVLTHVVACLNDLQDVLHGVFLVRELSARVLDFVMSFGERLSAYLISCALHHEGVTSEFLDARKFIKTNDRFGRAVVDYPLTFKLINKHVHPEKAIPVVTGFIASTKNNVTTTLGRSGSDFTASLLAAALKASELQIWTDVDGVLTADPQTVPQAFTIPQLTYEEAMELSHFGAEVIHPATMQPALEAGIPVRIKNTFNPGAPGTLITRKATPSPYLIRGVSSINQIALVSVIGSGMVGVTGVAAKIFGALAEKEINVILISQASSEHSVCFAVEPPAAQAAKQAIENALKLELLERRVSHVKIEKNLAIIAVVGAAMRQTVGIAGKVFQALGEKGINIVAIAQGSSELNISAVVTRRDLPRALRAIHDSFFAEVKVNEIA